MKITAIIKLILVSVVTVALASCSTAPKDELSSSANPREEIERLSADLNTAQKANVDVLARKDYTKSQKSLQSARDGLAKGKDQEKIIDDLRFGRASLKRAYSVADGRKGQAPGLFESRQNAIRAGAAQSSMLKNKWNSLDDEVGDKAGKLDKISIDDMEELQARYVEMEKEAIIETELGKAKSQISGARSAGAANSAPVALRKAEMSVKDAESLIGSNVRNPSGFKSAVVVAGNDALFLAEVVSAIKENRGDISEAAASKIVLQRRQIADLKSNLSTSKGAISDVRSKLNESEKTVAEREALIREKDLAIGTAQASLELQGAIERSRQQFLTSEAETYQQGGNLLIRLKSMNFKSGRAEIPNESMGLLGKVADTAKNLNAKELIVQGHTDSTGSIESNKRISEQRASVVAAYLRENVYDDTQVSYEGHGFDKPIATNKTAEGRAQNRRVDVIIVPASSPSILR